MRKVLAWCGALAIAAATMLGRADAQTTPAQNWPAKPIRIIVPYPPGGLSDLSARLIGDKLARVLGQSVVIDNRAGGNTIIGTQATAQSAPDGYTLLLTNGALTTAGGLVFIALMDGTVAAYDDATLDELWKVNVGSGIAAPPMSFAVNGKQFVAIATGPSGPAKAKIRNTPELKDQRDATVLYVFGL